MSKLILPVSHMKPQEHIGRRSRSWCENIKSFVDPRTTSFLANKYIMFTWSSATGVYVHFALSELIQQHRTHKILWELRAGVITKCYNLVIKMLCCMIKVPPSPFRFCCISSVLQIRKGMLHRLNFHNPDIPRSSNNSSSSDTLYFAKSLFSTLIYRKNNILWIIIIIIIILLLLLLLLLSFHFFLL